MQEKILGITFEKELPNIDAISKKISKEIKSYIYLTKKI